jgi:dihydroxyacid dehydratase/phosphogluconate dehydratase
MDARTNIKGRLPRRHGTEAPSCAPHRSEAAFGAAPGRPTNAALHLSTIELDLIDAGEIFKKTPYAAGLKPGGRYVAKDMQEIGGIPLLKTTLLDNGHLHGDCITVTGRTIAENLKSVMWTRHAVVRSAVDAVVGTLNVKLTDAELAEHETKWRPRATNPTSGALGKYAQQIGLAVDGAVSHPGGAHEKQCYADI